MPFIEGKLYEIVPPPPKEAGYKFNHANKPMFVVCTTNVFMFLNESKNNIDYVFYDVCTKDSISIDARWARANMMSIK